MSGLGGKFESSGIEKFDALGELGHGFKPVVRILDADHRWLDTKAVKF